MPPTAADQTGLETTRLADIKPMPVRWLVDRYVPLGKLTLWAAEGGQGKSSVARDLAAAVTQGRPAFGLTYQASPAADVLLVGVEDGLADTVAPALLAAGADLQRVRHVRAALDAKGKPSPFTVACVDELRAFPQVNPTVKLVVIDPITAYIGRARLDDHRTAVVRAALGPLAEVAEEYGAAFVLIIHFNKGEAAHAVKRVVGSAAYVNTVRNAWVILPSPEEPERRLLLPIKRNLPYHPKALAFHRESLDGPTQHQVLSPYSHLTNEDLAELGEQLAVLRWDGEVDDSADQVLRESQPGGKQFGTVEKCVKWLRQFVGEQAWPAKEILAAAKREGFTFDAQKEAKSRLIQAEGFEAKPLVLAGEWWFGQGPKAGWTPRPSPN